MSRPDHQKRGGVLLLLLFSGGVTSASSISTKSDLLRMTISIVIRGVVSASGGGDPQSAGDTQAVSALNQSGTESGLQAKGDFSQRNL